MVLQFGHPFLDTYLNYVEDTESPRIFHIWACLSGVGACLGRRCYFDFGFDKVFPNSYVVLIGPPGARKNTAINIMKNQLQNATGVRFAPDDTGGKHQGLITAMEGKTEDEELEDLIETAITGGNFDQLEAHNLKIDQRDQHVIFAIATELISFIGINNFEIINFLGKVYDGENYDYGLSRSRQILKEPLLSILGAATTTNLAQALPPQAIGQGFMSRMILVFGNKKHKYIAVPKALPEDKATAIRHVYSELHHRFDGIFTPTTAAEELLEHLYEQPNKLDDPRFLHYCDRRQTHLIKLAIQLSAGRLTTAVEEIDVSLAHTLLTATEVGMPDALGEYGLSPMALARQKMLDYIRAANGPVTDDRLWAVMQRDVKSRVDFLNALRDLAVARKVIQVTTDAGPAVVFNDAAQEEEERILENG